MSKHGNRPGSQFPKSKGNPKQVNAQAQEVVEDMLTNPGTIRTQTNTPLTRSRYGGPTIDFRDPKGRGVRFDQEGNFIGFLEP